MTTTTETTRPNGIVGATSSGRDWPDPGVYVAHGADIVVELTARTRLGARVRIRLDGFDASLVIGDDATASWLRADLDPASARTGIGLRDYVLRGPSVLAVGGYDIIRIESVEITSCDDLRVNVRADVYVKDVVSELPLRARMVVPDADTVLIAARATLDRTALDLTLARPWDRLLSQKVDVRAGIALHRTIADVEEPS